MDFKLKILKYSLKHYIFKFLFFISIIETICMEIYVYYLKKSIGNKKPRSNLERLTMYPFGAM